MSMTSCGIFVQLSRQPRHEPAMSAGNLSDSVRIDADIVACEECGSTSRVGRGFCLNCLLHRGLGCETETTETLQEVLDEVDVRDADWRIGNYQILEEIGRGGMGVIYRARQRHSRRIVALKRVLSFHSDSRETLARFRREAEAAASLDHPNILPIYEVSESDDGLPFFSMKFAAGGSLLDASRSLRDDPRRIVTLIAKVTRGVQHAHGHGILHRDLKPGNILLDSRGEPLVSDFGLAKWLDTSSDLTRTLTIFGTPGYIAPEQGQGPAKNVTPAADIYSIGAVLFDLFTGRTPFLGEHALAVIKQASEKPAPKLRALASSADRDLETICAKCLEREPQARYGSAADLAEDLERWLEGRPIIARPVSPPVRIWRWSKRDPKLAGSLAAAVVLGGIGVVAAFTSSRLSSVVQDAELARHSVVVTPFEDLDELLISSNSAKAVTNALSTGLQQIKGIHASNGEMPDADPWSADDWKKIGEAAGARFVLSGSVRQRERKQRVALRLIETASGSVVTTCLQDVDSSSDALKASLAKIKDVLGIPNTRAAIQANSLMIAAGNVNDIGATKNSSARGYYERGKELFLRNNLPDLSRAIDSFQAAIKIDSNYPQPYAMLATACLSRAVFEPNGQWRQQAVQAVATALRLAPMLPEAHLAQGDNLQLYGRLQASLDSFLTAYELDPASGRAAANLGYAYALMGRPDLAIVWFDKATRRETRPIYADNIGSAWLALGDYEKAEQAYQTAAVFRSDLPVGPLGLSTVALFRGDYENARKQCQDARAKYKDNPQPLMMSALIEFFSRHFAEAEKLYREALVSDRGGGVSFAGSVRFLSAIGFIRRAAGDDTEGKQLLEEARSLDEKDLASTRENPETLYSFAADSAALGDRDAALAVLDKAVAAGWIDYRSMQLDPRFDSLRSKQAFQKILTDLRVKVEEMRRHLPSRKLASTLTN
jgi:serine/threonine protein kinase/tetratricopeptide (TPR) repeat protein